MSQRTSSVLLAAAALAGGLSCAHAEGLYVGGGLATPVYSNAVNGIGGTGGGSGTGLKLYGGYQFGPAFSVEAGLYSLGHVSDANGTAKVRGAFVDGVGRYAFAPGWSVLGSLGVAEGRFSTTAGHDASPALKLGLGVEYELTRQVALRLQYDRYHFVNAFDSQPNLGAFSVGVKAGF